MEVGRGVHHAERMCCLIGCFDRRDMVSESGQEVAGPVDKLQMCVAKADSWCKAGTSETLPD